jgi:UDP-2,3-diacylglucosamine pyrophosphatase LpxH
MSDLHLGSKTEQAVERFWKKVEERVQTDFPAMLILAGDITDAYNETYRERLAKIIDRFSKLYPKVVFLAGNHDYWDDKINSRLAFFRTLAVGNVHFLEPDNNYTLPDGRAASGGTMWFPDCKDSFLKKTWCDHNYILEAMNGAIEAEHEAFIKTIKPQSIMITHHYPTAESIHPRYKNYISNCFFQAEMDETLKKWSEGSVLPRLWIHGHTHEPMDYVSKWGFRVYCNPLGHEFEGRNPDFWNRMSIDI